MRASIFFSAIFATAAVAAPLLEKVTSGPVGDIVEKVEEPVKSIISLDVTRRSPLGLEEATSALEITKGGLTDKLPLDKLPLEERQLTDLLGLDVSDTVSNLVSEVLGLLNTVETSLSSVVNDAENVDVGGILTTVRGLLSTVLGDVHQIVDSTGLSLPLNKRDNLFEPIATALSKVGDQLSSITGLDVASDLVDEINGVLDDVLRLVGNLLGNIL